MERPFIEGLEDRRMLSVGPTGCDGNLLAAPEPPATQVIARAALSSAAKAKLPNMVGTYKGTVFLGGRERLTATVVYRQGGGTSRGTLSVARK